MARRYHECLRCNAVGLGWQRSLLVLLATFPRHWMCKRASANIGITDHVSDRIALPRTKTIYYGIPDPLAHSLNSFHHPSTASTFCCAYVGRLVKEKGLFLLLEAAKRLKDEEYEFRLKFIGDGFERVHLEAKVAALSLQEHVQFNGFLQGQALEAALADVAIVVMPSIWEETAGLAAIEHMMRGRLVIAADIGGLGEVVGNAGLKFSPGDVDGLTARLRQVLDKPTLVVEVGRKARERALQYFCQERMVEEHYRLYEKLVKG
jgi:glycogen synthase